MGFRQPNVGNVLLDGAAAYAVAGNHLKHRRPVYVGRFPQLVW